MPAVLPAAPPTKRGCRHADAQLSGRADALTLEHRVVGLWGTWCVGARAGQCTSVGGPRGQTPIP
eukprot:11309763-Alexandrium_andersonii.AAC.1